MMVVQLTSACSHDCMKEVEDGGWVDLFRIALVCV